MFAKKPKPNAKKPAAEPERDLKELLAIAVERNTSIGVVRLGNSGQDPLAQGRLLEWTPGLMVVEQLQIIGRDVNLHVGNRIEAYVSFDNVMMTFEAKITLIDKPRHLNDQRLVRSMHLTDPKLLRQGDRRTAFRSSITSFDNDIQVRMWFLDRVTEPEAPANTNDSTVSETRYYTHLLDAKRSERLIPVDEEGNEPEKIDWPGIIKQAQADPPHAVGRLIDITANGIGILMYGIAKMQLNRFERLALIFTLDDTEIDLVVEMRQAVDLRGATCRVGFLLVHPSMGTVHAPQRRVLEKVAMHLQREQIRMRNAG